MISPLVMFCMQLPLLSDVKMSLCVIIYRLVAVGFETITCLNEKCAGFQYSGLALQ